MIKRLISVFLLVLLVFPFAAASAAAADTNLASGKTYTVEYVTPIDNAYPNLAYKEESRLTDGKTASASYSDSNWLQLYRGTAAIITIDLGEVCTVNEAELGMFQNGAAGILSARYVNVYVSEDGETYGKAGGIVDNNTVRSANVARINKKIAFDGSYKARYVRLEIESNIFLYVDEISVYGVTGTANAVSAPAYTEPADKGYAKAESLDGISSICLLYTSSGDYSQEKLRYYASYVDNNGNSTDMLFDSLLFLDVTASSYDSIDDMKAFMKKCIGASTSTNLTGLDKVIGELKSTILLGYDYKYPVFISTPTLGFSYDVFGEIDGEQIKLSSYESRMKVIQWYVDYVQSEFAACGFENIELKGMYWFTESINHKTSNHEEQLMAGFNEYCHSKDLKTIWIPYYSATGYELANDLGFDCATMQVGHAFDRGGESEVGNATADAVIDCVDSITKFGLGIEFEYDKNVSNSYNRFAAYVHGAYQGGLMEDGVMMMYQAGDHLYTCATGASSYRKVYDLLYSYCAKTYYESAPVIAEGQTITVTAGTFTTGWLEVTDEDTKSNSLKINSIQKPEGIYVLVEGDGWYEVDAVDSVLGTYKFTVSVTDGFNVSNTAEVTVIVEPDPNAPVEESDGNADTDTDSGGNTLIFVIIGAVILVIAAVAVVIIIKKKKH